MPRRDDKLTTHQLLESILACESCEVIHEIVADWLRANPSSGAPEGSVADAERPVRLGSLLHAIGQEAGLIDTEAEAMSDRKDRRRVFVLCARPSTSPSSLEPLAVYSQRDLAESWISAQDPGLQEMLEVRPLPVDEHAAIQTWLQAHPAPLMNDVLMARVDAALEGWYRALYDPRIVSPSLAELVATAERLAPDRDAIREWVTDWVHEPNGDLGGQVPVQLLQTAEGLDLVRDLLIRALER